MSLGRYEVTSTPLNEGNNVSAGYIYIIMHILIYKNSSKRLHLRTKTRMHRHMPAPFFVYEILLE
jgi:hypothetical protein